MKKHSYNLNENVELGNVNPGFVVDGDPSTKGDSYKIPTNGVTTIGQLMANDKEPLETAEVVAVESGPERQQWSNGVEFLMSCIAMSVGLGNIWRFPFTAYENGGGAFLIPYIIVLFVIGKPLYYMEMALGQFTSCGAVKIWNSVPLLSGLGYGQIFSTVAVLTYYCSLMALTSFYLFASFTAELPWANCQPEWGENCFNSTRQDESSVGNLTGNRSSSELYFLKYVLNEKEDIEDGIGVPEWRLTLCLLLSWISIFLVIMRGVKGSGKAAYFLALFPYVVMIALLIRGVTLPGAIDGIKFFITPQWDQLLNPKVWYAAVAQAFFSLAVGFGSIVVYSSYNDFSHNVHRDAVIVTTLDTFTSLLAGCTIFAILGNLAHEMGVSEIKEVVKGGTGLAFISYPDAIAKFDVVPQLFSVLFFLMLYTLGIGSAVALAGAVITITCDQFPNVKYWVVTLITCIGGFLIGLIYITPGGQFMLNLVDFYAATLVVFILACVEMIGLAWIYGVNNFCDDIEFMLGHKVSIYWRLCWGIFTPLLLIIILIYSISIMKPLEYIGHLYPDSAYAAGWVLLAFGVLQVPIWGVHAMLKHHELSIPEMIKKACQPNDSWGPKSPQKYKEWKQFKEMKKREEESIVGESTLRRIIRKCSGIGNPTRMDTSYHNEYKPSQ